MRLIFIFCLVVSFIVVKESKAQNAFENLLKKNETYKTATEKLESKEWFNEGTKKVGEFLEKRKNEKTRTATEEAELFYQGKVSDKPCVHCPSYLNLIKEVNKIVAKTSDKTESIASYNDRMLELNKLKFLYYSTREITETGEERCQKWNSFDPLDRTVLGGNTKLLAEEVLHMPNVTSIQYMPRGNEQDVYYYYRGEGINRNVVVEVKMSRNGEATVRYYRYQVPGEYSPETSLPDLGSPSSPPALTAKDDEKDEDYLDIKMGLKTRKLILPTDIEIAEAGKTVNLTENVRLKSKTNLAFNEQKTSMSLASSTGEDWVKIEAANQTQGETKFATTIPLEIDLQKDSDLKLGGEIKREMVRDFNKPESAFATANTVKFGLTDHNHEYISAEVISKSDGLRNVALSNRYSLGDYGNVAGKYEFDNKGNRSYSVGKETNLGNYGTLTTSYGVTQDRKQFVEFGHQKKISDTASMALTIKGGQGQPTTLMYQIQAKF